MLTAAIITATDAFEAGFLPRHQLAKRRQERGSLSFFWADSVFTLPSENRTGRWFYNKLMRKGVSIGCVNLTCDNDLMTFS